MFGDSLFTEIAQNSGCFFPQQNALHLCYAFPEQWIPAIYREEKKIGKEETETGIDDQGRPNAQMEQGTHKPGAYARQERNPGEPAEETHIAPQVFMREYLLEQVMEQPGNLYYHDGNHGGQQHTVQPQPLHGR